MRRFLLVVLVVAFWFGISAQAQPSSSSTIIIFEDQAFPLMDSSAALPADLATVLPNARFADANQLSDALSSPSARLLVISGSAFPEQAWPAIYGFLQHGGNLLALGGRPFARAAYRDGNKWGLRPERNAFIRKLLINDYTETPASGSMQFETNPDFPEISLPKFDWNRAWSLTVKLSGEDMYPRGGSTGSLDTTFHALAWGSTNAHRLAAPVVEMDHFQNNFVGGRWEVVAADLSSGFFASVAGQKLVSTLAERALQGAHDFSVRPHWALFLPGESLSFQFMMRDLVSRQSLQPVRVELTVTPEEGPATLKTFDLTPEQFPYITELNLPAAAEKGFHVVTARLLQGDTVRGVYRTGFWIRDLEYLNSGPRLTVNHDFFELDGRPLPVIGSTHMASDVQRDFFMLPNPYVWDQDFVDMQRNGVNMVRTGWWSAWDQVMKETGVLHEESLRAIEAYLMTARRHNMPVQFNFFAFIPDVFGGQNPYLDPEAVRRQKTFISAVVERFKNIPWLAYDLINEPSFDKPAHLWATRANGDGFEMGKWNEWLRQQYPDNGAIGAAWNTIPASPGSPAPPPGEQDFNPAGGTPIAVHDFYMFAQQAFTQWVAQMRDTIHGTGSKQLITLGQDEGGGTDRLNPQFWGEAVDFTTNHTWWQNDALLWDSLVAKYPGKPLLIQETGLQNDFNMDATWRRDAQSQANVLERKLATALATTAGGIDWLWNVNSYMTLDQEVTIGMVRTDGTDKPEVAMFRSLADFAGKNRDAFRKPEMPQVAILTSQSFQYSALNPMAIAAQQKSVRVLHNYLGVPAYMVAENQISTLGNPRLLIVPSPEALPESTWNALLSYAEAGGTVLITGSMERDPHWVTTHRLKSLGVEAERIDLNFRQGTIRTPQQTIPVSFSEQKWLDALRFADGSTWKEIPHGKGRLLISAFPVELAEGNDATVATYRLALKSAGASPSFDAKQGLPGVLIRPTVFADSVLYLFMSESGQDEDVDITDKLTGARMNFRLPTQRARLVLLNKKDGSVLSRYGF
jgi:hypothetical protein